MSDDDMIRRVDALRVIDKALNNATGDLFDAYAAIADLPPVTVGVKSLDWEGDGHWSSGDDEGWLEEAHTPFGYGYAIEFGRHGEGAWVVDCGFGIGPHMTGFDSPDAAKAAAQADYETRIRAALEPTPLTSTTVDDSKIADTNIKPTLADALAMPEISALLDRADKIDPILEVGFDTQLDVEQDPFGARQAIENALYLIRDMTAALSKIEGDK